MPNSQTLPPRGDEEVDSIPVSLIGNGVGVISLLGWLFLMLSRGALVTRREHENRIADMEDSHQKALADKDAQIITWKAAAETNAAQRDVAQEHAGLSVQLWQAIEKRASAPEDT